MEFPISVTKMLVHIMVFNIWGERATNLNLFFKPSVLFVKINKDHQMGKLKAIVFTLSLLCSEGISYRHLNFGRDSKVGRGVGKL